MIYILLGISLIFSITWLLVYKKHNKLILSLPYLFMLFITPIYEILDNHVFLKIFGCGCVPSTQTNMLNIPFNANNLRALVFSVISVLMVVLGGKLSRKIKEKPIKILYVVIILITNIVIENLILEIFMWL